MCLPIIEYDHLDTEHNLYAQLGDDWDSFHLFFKFKDNIASRCVHALYGLSPVTVYRAYTPQRCVFTQQPRVVFISDHDCDAQKPRHGCLAPRCATVLHSASTKLQPLDAVAAPLSPSLRLPRYCTLQAPAAAAA